MYGVGVTLAIALYYSQDFCVHAKMLFDSNMHSSRPTNSLSENLGVDPKNGPMISEKLVTIIFLQVSSPNPKLQSACRSNFMRL